MRATPIDNLGGGRVKQARDIMKHFQTKSVGEDWPMRNRLQKCCCGMGLVDIDLKKLPWVLVSSISTVKNTLSC